MPSNAMPYGVVNPVPVVAQVPRLLSTLSGQELTVLLPLFAT
jgi:hypothetical protein